MCVTEHLSAWLCTALVSWWDRRAGRAVLHTAAIPVCAVRPLVDLGGAVGPPEVVDGPGSCILLGRRKQNSGGIANNSSGGCCPASPAVVLRHPTNNMGAPSSLPGSC